MDQVLPMAEFAYNSSVNRSTGHSPFEVVLGANPRKPIDLVVLPSSAHPSVEAEAFSDIFWTYMMKYGVTLLSATISISHTQTYGKDLQNFKKVMK